MENGSRDKNQRQEHICWKKAAQIHFLTLDRVGRGNEEGAARI